MFGPCVVSIAKRAWSDDSPYPQRARHEPDHRLTPRANGRQETRRKSEHLETNEPSRVGSLVSSLKRCPLFKLATIVVIVIAVGAALVTTVSADHEPALLWVDEPAVTPVPGAVSMDWLSDGRALVLAQNGVIYLVDPATGTSSSYLTVPSVDATAERGALDLVVDTASSNPQMFYVYYSHHPTTRLRIAEYEFTGNGAMDAASASMVWENPGPSHDEAGAGPNHIGGSLNITPDGNYFYLSIGDGLTPTNATDLTNVFGKILRISRDGLAPADNPFFDAAGPNIDEIWAYGLRNPWKASFDVATGRYLFGDVGGNDAEIAYEELNLGIAGANYGWPSCEGPVGLPKNGPVCPNGVTAPLLSYAHNPAAGCCQNAAITGGEVFRSSELPPELFGAYIFADFSHQDVRWATFAPDGSVEDWGVLQDLSVIEKNPTWLGAGPDGHIYYIHYDFAGASQVRRLRYVDGSSHPPVVNGFTATPDSVALGAAITFEADASDPDETPIIYLWDFGDGSNGGGRAPTHTYAAPGEYQVSLRVESGGNTAFGEPLTVVVGDVPTVVITSPDEGLQFDAGDSIELSATGTGTGPLSWRWTIQFAHDDHLHPESSSVGDTATFTIPTSGHDFIGDTGYVINVEVTDGFGLTAVDQVEVAPNTAFLTFDTSPPGLLLQVDGITKSTPFVLKSVYGFEHEIEAPATACVDGAEYEFTHWTEGIERVQTVVAARNAGTITAHFVPNAACLSDPEPAPDEPEAVGYWTLAADGTVRSFGDAIAHGAPELGSNALQIVSSATGEGYWILETTGWVHDLGDAQHHGDLISEGIELDPDETAVTLSPLPDDSGYWIFKSRGRAVAFGTAQHYGDASYLGSVPEVLMGATLNEPIAGLAATADNRGYWLIAADGGVFSFGSAPFLGSIPSVLGGRDLNEPVVGAVAYGAGYLLVASDGGVFVFSDLPFLGSTGETGSAEPVVAAAQLR
jgi:glucose/arabinose dehydrogenase